MGRHPPPLHIAIRGGHTGLVQTLLAATASPMLLSSAGIPPLVVAAHSQGSAEALQLLIDARALLTSRDRRRQTALHAAARSGCLPALRTLIALAKTASQSEPSPLDTRDRWNRTALHWAVVNQQEQALEMLVSAGASVRGAPLLTKQKQHSKATHLPLESPLHSAARLPPNAAARLVQRLLSAGASVDDLDSFGQTPLHIAAASSGQSRCASCSAGGDDAAAVVRLLLEAAAVAAQKDHSGRSALDLAYEFAGGEPSVVAALQSSLGAPARSG